MMTAVDAFPPETGTAPSGFATRWRPNRAGIFNVWEFDDQVFEFGDGRLVLRGRNGSGKSNALSLLFPFLLDGVMSASRMDPMGGARSMKSLLLGRSDESGSARYRHDSGTGYVWMEFARLAETGAEGSEHEVFTIGIGASATAQRDADSWFFVTPQRIGIDLELHNDDVPKSRRRLIETMNGEVFTTAQEYRAALDRELFGLGDDRFRILVDLVLTLRRPHLAGKFDIDHLSATLTAGLAELERTLIDDVAHSFDDLDSMQHELNAMATALAAVERFLPVYQAHLVGVGRARADELVRAHADARSFRKQLAGASVERTDAEAAAAESIALIEHLRSERRSIESEIDTVRTSKAFESIAAIAEVERTATRARVTAEQLDEIAARAATRVKQSERDRLGAQERHERATGKLSALLDGWIDDVRSLGIDWPAHVAPDQPFPADRAVSAITVRRDEVSTVIAASDAAAETAADAERRRIASGIAQTEFSEARTSAAGAVADAQSTRDQLRADRVVWARTTDALLANADAEIDPAVSGGVTIDGFLEATSVRSDDDRVGGEEADEEPVRRDVDLDVDDHLDAVLSDAVNRLARIRDRAITGRDDQAVVVRELDDDRLRVAEEPNPGPPANPTRPDAQSDRPGIALYACVEFADSVAETDRPGLEAALHAAGILDARILPDGVATDALDAVVKVVEVEPVVRKHPVSNVTLADLLVPVPTGDLSADTIHAVLARVRIDAATTRVSADGTWRLGPLAGRFTQESARYVGHEARERRRAHRLVEIDAELTTARRVFAERVARIATIDTLVEAIDDARVGRPPLADLVAAVGLVVRCTTIVRERSTRAAGALQIAERADEVDTVAAAELQRLAVLHRLTTDRSELDDDRRRLEACRGQVERVVDGEHQVADAASGEDRASAEASEAREEAMRRQREASDAAAIAGQEAVRYERLRNEVGTDARQAQDQLADAEARLADTSRRVESQGDIRRNSELLVATLIERINGLTTSAAHAEHTEAAALARFAAICSTEVAEVLDIDGVDPESDGLRAARALLADTQQAPDDATNRMERAYREIILEGLRAGNDPSMPKLDGFDVIRVATVEGDVAIGELAQRLRHDNERVGNLLSTKEREIFETHLLTNIGDSIRRLLLAADEFEQRINAEMSKAPTSSEMVVELAWQTVDEPGLRDAVALLRRSPDMLGPEQRESLRSFLVQRIDDIRSADPGLNFSESLAAALDYRLWHRFDLFARFADGPRQRITRRLFSTLSGGEQAVVLHLPLFAAASSQYSSGSVAGPRLIALDEAFVGIDDPMRASLMGLLNQLDLDLLVTSHEFWGFYEQVPDLVVYDLVRNPAVPGVYAQRFDWTASEG